MKIPTAAERRAKMAEKKAKKADTMKQIARKFITEKIVPAMDKTDGYCVNIEHPGQACEDKDGFLAACREILPNDYKVELSHDGGGMYGTLCVSWRPEKKRK